MTPTRRRRNHVVAAVSVALSQPLRRRVQDTVDRRFNRSRFDAERTVDDFVRRLRNDVDLESVRADLLGVTREIVHPDPDALWLRTMP